jgi:hypothetical protein
VSAYAGAESTTVATISAAKLRPVANIRLVGLPGCAAVARHSNSPAASPASSARSRIDSSCSGAGRTAIRSVAPMEYPLVRHVNTMGLESRLRREGHVPTGYRLTCRHARRRNWSWDRFAALVGQRSWSRQKRNVLPGDRSRTARPTGDATVGAEAYIGSIIDRCALVHRVPHRVVRAGSPAARAGPPQSPGELPPPQGAASRRRTPYGMAARTVLMSPGIATLSTARS